MEMRTKNHTVAISNDKKILYPDNGLSKKDIAIYYQKISTTLLPHIRDRILTMERYPDGIDDGGFIQQQAEDYFHGAVAQKMVKRKDGSDLNRILCYESACLIYLANLGAITLHMWLSRVDKPELADRMIFDLDPPGDDFSMVRKGALALRELLEEIGLSSFVMTTGSKGAHVVVPLKREKTFDGVRSCAEEVAALLAGRYENEMTVAQRKDKRGGRLYIDVMRNGYGQTGVVPYTLRPRPGAPVATPLSWDELERFQGKASTYTLKNIFQRLGQKEDPWKHMARHARSLAGPTGKLAALRGRL